MHGSVVDLFCGIGGLTKGLSLAGLNVVAGIDIDKSCKFAYEKNNSARFIHKDIAKLSSEEIQKLFPQGEKSILVGCAPCQPFSRYSIRYRKDGQPNDKWKLLYSFEKIVRGSLPDIVSMENVPGLVDTAVFKSFTNCLEELAYYINWGIVYCPQYGVPQNRKRLVLLASRLGKIKLISPKFHKENYPTVRNAIGDLRPICDGQTDEFDPVHKACKLSSKNLKRIRQSKPGGTWKDWDEELQLKCHKKKSGYTYPSVYGRMSWDEPSPTITTQFYGYGNGRFGHPEQDRAISLREGALLQSFPKDYIFFDDGHPISRKEMGIHIGNAVPVELGRAIGQSIIQHLEEVKYDGREKKNDY